MPAHRKPIDVNTNDLNIINRNITLLHVRIHKQKNRAFIDKDLLNEYIEKLEILKIKRNELNSAEHRQRYGSVGRISKLEERENTKDLKKRLKIKDIYEFGIVGHEGEFKLK